MSSTSKGFAPTKFAARYVQQLVKHWGHKFETSYANGVGIVPFNESAIARFHVESEGVRIDLQTATAEANEGLRGVIERHLDRFAFREAPLTYSWEDAE
ncbi:MAG: DUF2218 domain-containing protein [Sphingomonadaceae bacterium]|nr:DUF2218 domain-containing protein [Sphingomonadaceae bacterium]